MAGQVNPPPIYDLLPSASVVPPIESLHSAPPIHREEGALDLKVPRMTPRLNPLTALARVEDRKTR